MAENPNDKLYIQVTESMQSPETRERELRPLRMIPDNYEKIVLSMDRSYINSYDGIKSLYLIDWLLSWPEEKSTQTKNWIRFTPHLKTAIIRLLKAIFCKETGKLTAKN